MPGSLCAGCLSLTHECGFSASIISRVMPTKSFFFSTFARSSAVQFGCLQQFA